MKRLDEIRARWATATPGPWACFSIHENRSGLRIEGGHAGYAELAPKDAEAIAQAPADIAALTGAIEDVQQQVNQMYASAKFTEQVGTHPLVAIRLRQFADQIGKIIALEQSHDD